MADLTLSAQSPLGGFDQSWGQTRLRERGDLALVSAACPIGGAAGFAAALEAQGFRRPTPRVVAQIGDKAALAMTADQVMLVWPDATARPERALAEAFGDAAYVTLQTDAWVVLDLEGPAALPALERLCPLDLHPDAFPIGAQARTVMEHMGAVIWRTGPQGYRLMSASSSARNFLHAVEISVRYVV